MSEYQVLARKYRPQSFTEVIGQSAIVATLKNAIKFQRLAHAYLFCGSRGTGKTTLARVFSKALNCQQPTSDLEPCNACSSCKEIASGTSLDVLEIDGASHRGIDDIRQINETVGYASSCGKYKIYIIDEVHMLTKEAFNALLKTLEEPPPKVKFLFATTEPHKVLPTILSRCQRFNLSRIPVEQIRDKLFRITQDLGISAEEKALRILANHADGGLRDAESLLDQILAFHEGPITADAVASILGIMPQEALFALDRAGKEGNLAFAFDLVHRVFAEGKDLTHFVETLTEHFRHLLVIKVSGKSASFLPLTDVERDSYDASAKLYTQEQCMTILDMLIEAQSQIRFAPSGKIALEALLLRIMRTHYRLPIEILVRRLAELEQAVAGASGANVPPMHPRSEVEPTVPISTTAKIEAKQPATPPKVEVKQVAPIPQPMAEVKQVLPVSAALPPPIQVEKQPSLALPQEKAPIPSSISIDPTPSFADLGIKAPRAPKSVVEAAPKTASQHPQSRHDTILQFAAVELEGTIQKKQVNRP